MSEPFRSGPGWTTYTLPSGGLLLFHETELPTGSSRRKTGELTVSRAPWEFCTLSSWAELPETLWRKGLLSDVEYFLSQTEKLSRREEVARE